MTSRTTWPRATAHVAGLWALVVAYPVLDVLSHAPEFFVAHRADGRDLVLLACVVVYAGPLLLAALLGLAAGLGRAALGAATAVLVGVLLAIYGAQVGYRAGVAGWLATGTAGLTCAAAGATAWWRSKTVRSVLGVLGLSAFVVPVLFLGAREIRPLLWARDATVAVRHASRAAPVVVMVFDELPLLSLLDGNGRLNADRFPNLAALAADGVWFRNATAVSDFTRWALPAIAAGRYPRPDAVPSAAAHPQNLFTALAPTHRLEVFEPLTAMCPSELCRNARVSRSERQRRMMSDVAVVMALALLPPDAREGLPDLTQGWSGFAAGADDTGDASVRQRWQRGEKKDHYAIARSFIDGIGPDDEQPTLYFLHTIVSHHPPHLLPSGQRIANFVEPPGMTRALTWVNADWPVRVYHQGAILQAELVDTIVGLLRARLQEVGLYDRALVVITADHGISFTPGTPVRNFSDAAAAGTVPVPLIVKLPSGDARRRPGTIEDRNVETIDILPSIADVLGIALPAPVDGAPVFGSVPPRPTKRLYYDGARKLRTFGTDEIARLRDREAARQAQVLGTGRWPSPAPSPSLAPLVGQPLSSLSIEVVRTSARVLVDNEGALESVDPSAPSLPVQVTGRVSGVGRESMDSVFLVVAVNGVVAATTRTWTSGGTWMALIPPDRLRRGANELEVFTVDPVKPTRLVTTRVRRALPEALDLLSVAAGTYGVSYRGMYHLETTRAAPFRWTDGAGEITAPIADGAAPMQLDVDVLFSGRDGKRLRILIDDCEVLSDSLPAGRWTRMIPLGRCRPSGRWTTLRFLSDTHQAARDRRRLGVALTRVALRN